MVISDCHFRKTATAVYRKPGITGWSGGGRDRDHREDVAAREAQRQAAPPVEAAAAGHPAARGDVAVDLDLRPEAALDRIGCAGRGERGLQPVG
jgi:hypothetical protein